MKRRIRHCKVCGDKYEPKNYWQKYCSASCKTANWALEKLKKKKDFKI